jgi:hypothetical protein
MGLTHPALLPHTPQVARSRVNNPLPVDWQSDYLRYVCCVLIIFADPVDDDLTSNSPTLPMLLHDLKVSPHSFLTS